MEIREAQKEDLFGLLELYQYLGDNPVPQESPELDALWERIIGDPNIHPIVLIEEGRAAASCTVTIIPNLTHSQRPYALVENVVTHPDHNGKGFGTAVLDYAKKLAQSENCYKIMLCTSSKAERTLNFYRRAGYESETKTAFYQKL
ncbi:MAG: GNAT family N-acetyltransferase [Oscillospiraceae bacterium]|nr:GNAT family N-acetyltransferase [Oscillospiraceae bacterium]